MELKDLKTGMIVQLRNDDFYRVMLNTEQGDLLINKKGGITLSSEFTRTNDCDKYSNDLKYQVQSCFKKDSDHAKLVAQFDIIKVYKPDYTMWGYTDLHFEHLELIYNRNQVKIYSNTKRVKQCDINQNNVTK